jgi:short-subunit dehydrogenase
MTEALEFADRYGPWALIAGASEGVGAALARTIGELGVNVVLIARRQAALDRVAASVSTETCALAIDLADEDAMRTIADATADFDIGLLVYCAGADANYETFLGQPVGNALAMVQRNCIVPLEMCHHFAKPMVARRRGGIVLVGSGAGLIGAPNMVAYGATKAFDMVMGEALWAELHDQGVDVLSLVLGMTDTPALRRLMRKRGQLTSADDDAPIPGAVSAEETAAAALANLTNGPTYFVGDMLRDGAKTLGSMPRNDAVRMMAEMAKTTMAADA